MKNRILKYLSLIFILVLASTVYYSFSNAKAVADAIVVPVSDQLKRSGCKLSLFHFQNGEFSDNYTALGWKVLYGTNETYSNDIEIYVSLNGVVEMTNPRDLKERIQRLKDK